MVGRSPTICRTSSCRKPVSYHGIQVFWMWICNRPTPVMCGMWWGASIKTLPIAQLFAWVFRIFEILAARLICPMWLNRSGESHRTSDAIIIFRFSSIFFGENREKEENFLAISALARALAVLLVEVKTSIPLGKNIILPWAFIFCCGIMLYFLWAVLYKKEKYWSSAQDRASTRLCFSWAIMQLPKMGCYDN